MRLSETQRVAFYELVTASLKAADTLVNSCPSETALTPVGRMDTMRKRLPALIALLDYARNFLKSRVATPMPGTDNMRLHVG